MPTQNPRITVTLTPEVHAVLTEMSRETGQSLSSIVGELCGVSVPVFQRVVEALRAAREVQTSASTEIASGLERAQAKLEAQMEIAMGHIDEGLRPLLHQAEAVKRRAGRAAGGSRQRAPADERPAPAPTPVAVTRGSGHPTHRPKVKSRGGF